MTKRLTEHKTMKGITEAIAKPCIDTMQPIIDKLARIEDILEEYNIDSIELLKDILEDNKFRKEIFTNLFKQTIGQSMNNNNNYKEFHFEESETNYN